jgi:BirA family biotin operon repressor/biotin-[acetyl-CoA-carboxylase] ligase
MLASVLLRRSPVVASGIPFAAGLALVDVLAAEQSGTAGLKWPNDVLVDGRKLAGILCEVEPATSNEGVVAIALGIGVNLTVSVFPDDFEAVSLHTLVATPPEAEELLLAWSQALGVRIDTLEQSGIGGLLGDWRRCAVGLGSPVTVHAAEGMIEGIAIDVGDDGALLVDSSGRIYRFLAADVHLGSAPR